MNSLAKDELLQRLKRLDEDVDLTYDDDRRFRMVIVGGSALILLETITRATNDIDALNVSPEISGLLEKYDINIRVSAYINNFPYNYEDRLHPISIGGKRIDFYTASLEDIVIAKLYGGRAKDIQDITNENVLKSIDWLKLDNLAKAPDEARASNPSDLRYKEFLDCYEEYVKRWKPCES